MSAVDTLTIEPAEQHARELLTSFLAERAARCPACGVDLKELADDRCPRCRQHLVVTLDPTGPHFGWFLVLVAPLLITFGFTFLAGILVQALPPNEPRTPWLMVPISLADLLVLATLYVNRAALLTAPRRRRIRRALLCWGIHVVLALLVGASMAL